jgi:hypothetical protein
MKLAQMEAHLDGAKKTIIRERKIRESEAKKSIQLEEHIKWLKMVDNIGNNALF